jgi:hypothetical protein
MSKMQQQLAPHLTKHLVAYAAVAGAVATGASRAAAEVVYTPAHAKINGSFYLDLNHDGINDFHFSSYYFSAIGNVSVFPLIQGNRIAATHERCGFQAGNAAALGSGAVIGQNLIFLAKANCMAIDDSGFSSGPWSKKKDHYLGFAFVIDGKEHFGWARITVHPLPDVNNEILGYAYETVPGKPIVAGDEGNSTGVKAVVDENSITLGVLAMGAAGVDIWRGKED